MPFKEHVERSRVRREPLGERTRHGHLRQQLRALAAEVDSLKRQQASPPSPSAPSPLTKVRSAIALKTTVPLTPTDIAALQKVSKLFNALPFSVSFAHQELASLDLLVAA